MDQSDNRYVPFNAIAQKWITYTSVLNPCLTASFIDNTSLSSNLQYPYCFT